MKKSARILGRSMGLNAQEMNVLLKQYGYLQGEPGMYQVTEKGRPFAEETHHSRGTGGSIQYNPSWTVTTYDEEILEALERDIAAGPPPVPVAEPEVVEELDPTSYVLVAGGREGRQLGRAWVWAGIAVTAIGAGVVAAPHLKRVWVEKIKPRARKTWDKVRGTSDEPAATELDDPGSGI